MFLDLEIAAVDRYMNGTVPTCRLEIAIHVSIVPLVALVDGCGELYGMRRERQRC